MKMHLVAGAVLTLSAVLAGAQDQPQGGSDYPTIERVQFVEFCIREHPDRPRQEMLYKCSCTMDKIIAQMSYEEYVDTSTAYAAGQVAGKRGTGVRESTVGHTLTDRYRTALRAAMKDCLISQ
jgi:hypothetical protein